MSPRLRILLGLVLATAVACGRTSEAAHKKPRKPPPTPLVEQMPKVDPARTIEGRLLVAGMTCSGCEYNVSTAMKLVAGVLEAEADHVSGEAYVRFDPSMTSLAELAEAVRTTGYVVAPIDGER